MISLALKANYKNDIFTGNRKYNLINNADETISLEDVTDYVEEGDSFGAGDMNATNKMASHMIYQPTLDTGVVAGDCVIKNVDNDIYVKSQQGNGIVDGDGNVIKSGGIATGLNLTKGYTHYVPSDGGMPTTTPTDYEAGFARSATELEVRLPKGGRNKEYNTNMLIVQATPNEAGKIALQLKKHPDMKGFKLHRGLTPYDGSGESWGILVADITDDTPYHGTDRYIDSGLIDGTEYHYNCFGYKDGVVNIANNEANKASSEAGGLAHAYLKDVSGTTMTDSVTSGAMPLTSTNVAFQPTNAGYKGILNGSDSWFGFALDSGIQSLFDGDFTVSFVITPDVVGGTYHTIIALSKYMVFKCSLGTDAKMSIKFGDGGTTLQSDIAIQPSTRYHVLIKRSLSQGMKLKINNVVVSTSTYTGGKGSENYNILDFGRSKTQTEYYDGSMELLKLFSISTSDGADDSLYEEAMTI